MIRRKLTRIELQLDDTKELEDLFNRPIITQYNIHRAFQNPSAIEKQLQTELTSNFTIATAQQQQPQQDASNQVATTSGVVNNNNTNNISTNDSLVYTPQPYNNSSIRFQQFNKSGIR